MLLLQRRLFCFKNWKVVVWWVNLYATVYTVIYNYGPMLQNRMLCYWPNLFLSLMGLNKEFPVLNENKTKQPTMFSLIHSKSVHSLLLIPEIKHIIYFQIIFIFQVPLNQSLTLLRIVSGSKKGIISWLC